MRKLRVGMGMDIVARPGLQGDQEPEDPDSGPQIYCSAVDFDFNFASLLSPVCPSPDKKPTCAHSIASELQANLISPIEFAVCVPGLTYRQALVQAGRQGTMEL